MLLKCLANYVLLCKGCPSSALLLTVDLVQPQFVPRRWRCHQWKDPSGIPPRSQEQGSRDDLGKRVLERENKNKTNKQTPNLCVPGL